MDKTESEKNLIKWTLLYKKAAVFVNIIYRMMKNKPEYVIPICSAKGSCIAK